MVRISDETANQNDWYILPDNKKDLLAYSSHIVKTLLWKHNKFEINVSAQATVHLPLSWPNNSQVITG